LNVLVKIYYWASAGIKVLKHTKRDQVVGIKKKKGRPQPLVCNFLVEVSDKVINISCVSTQ